MTWIPELAVGVISIAGALLFFGAGYLAARIKGARSAQVPAGEPEPGHPGQDGSSDAESAPPGHEAILLENERLKQDNLKIIAAAKSRITRLKREVNGAAAGLEELRARLEQAGSLMAEAHSERARLAEELQRCREAPQGLDDGELDEIRRELSLKTEKLAQQSGYIAELEERNRELGQHAERLDEEFARLSDLEGTNIELAIRAQRCDEQQEDLDALRDENRSLQSGLAELAGLRKELERLKGENARLSSMGIVLQGSPPPPVMSSSPDGLGGAFQSMVNALSKNESSRGVVLADELGLLVAGTGDHTEPMAAMAAVFSTLNERVGSIFPIGPIDQIVIENTDDLTITMQPYEIATEKLVLTALSVGPGPDREAVLRLIEQAAA
jgi:predicted regulator of Ras-like GTPase activity (Roadblock/LC7/MglB family)